MNTNHRPERLNAKVTTSLETARKNKNKLKELVATTGLTDAQIVNIVMAESRWPCGVRTLIGWLSGDEQKKLQRCPDWAIEALEKGLRRR